MVFSKKNSRSAKPRALTPALRRAKQSALPEETFWVREVKPSDLDRLVELASHLNSVNLPNNRSVLRRLIQRSRRGFESGEETIQREYLFVLEGSRSGVVGTSMLFAQHGHHDAPHIYFDVLRDERYSLTLDRHFSHLCLRLGFSYRGPTEVGGLVLDPRMRSLGLGKILSFVRFLFIAMYRERFRPWVIAELMPPLMADGRSELWEYLGRHFTGLSYQDADKLSQTNKEFITSLFPQTPIYVSLFPDHVQALIGEVGEETRGVRRMLESIGFVYSERIDPFDGGPHFEAETDKITLVKQASKLLVAKDTLPATSAPESESRALIGVGLSEGPCRFRAARSRVRVRGDEVLIEKSVASTLRIKAGTTVWLIPL